MGANTDVIKRVDCMYKSVPAKRAPARAHIAAFIVRIPATLRMAPRDGGLGGEGAVTSKITTGVCLQDFKKVPPPKMKNIYPKQYSKCL